MCIRPESGEMVVSIHASTREATCPLYLDLLSSSFNPRLHEGGDTILIKESLYT